MTTLTEEQQGDADLEAGFNKEPPPVTVTETPAEVKVDAPAPAPEAPAPEKPPEYVQLTKEEHARLLALVDKTAEWSGKLDRALGTFGSVQDVVKKLQSQTPQGVAVEYPDELFAEMETDYPGLAGQIKAVLQKGSVKGTAPAADDKKADDPPAKSVAEQLKEQRIADNVAMLDEAFPDWRTLVGNFGDTNNDFRKWLATQPDEDQKRLNNSTSAFTIGRYIDNYRRDRRREKLAQKKPAPAPNKRPDPAVVARRDRIEGSVQPRGDAGPPPRRDTANDELNEGFYGRKTA